MRLRLSVLLLLSLLGCSAPPPPPGTPVDGADEPPREPDSVTTVTPVRSYPLTVTLQSNGLPGNKVDMVLLGDGYTVEQLRPGGKLEQHARRMVRLFFSAPPFDKLRPMFNIILIAAPSRQSGADPDQRDSVDTRYNSGYNSHGIRRLLTVRNKKQIRRDLAALPACDLALLLVNHTRYGGSGSTLYRSGTTVPLPIAAAGNAGSIDIALHECGHSLANLGDEYVQPEIAATYPLSGASGCPNIDTTADLTRIKWRAFFKYPGSRPLLGAYQGAYYRQRGVYRPQRRCKMRSLNSPFCHVCRKALTRAVYRICNIRFDEDAYHKKNPVTGPGVVP